MKKPHLDFDRLSLGKSCKSFFFSTTKRKKYRKSFIYKSLGSQLGEDWRIQQDFSISDLYKSKKRKFVLQDRPHGSWRAGELSQHQPHHLSTQKVPSSGQHVATAYTDLEGRIAPDIKHQSRVFIKISEMQSMTSQTRMRGSFSWLFHQLVAVFLDCYLYFRHSTFFGYTHKILSRSVKTLNKWKTSASFALVICSQLNWNNFPPLPKEKSPHRDFKQFHWSAARVNPGQLVF